MHGASCRDSHSVIRQPVGRAAARTVQPINSLPFTLTDNCESETLFSFQSPAVGRPAF